MPSTNAKTPRYSPALSLIALISFECNPLGIIAGRLAEISLAILITA